MKIKDKPDDLFAITPGKGKNIPHITNPAQSMIGRIDPEMGLVNTPLPVLPNPGNINNWRKHQLISNIHTPMDDGTEVSHVEGSDSQDLPEYASKRRKVLDNNTNITQHPHGAANTLLHGDTWKATYAHKLAEKLKQSKKPLPTTTKTSTHKSNNHSLSATVKDIKVKSKEMAVVMKNRSGKVDIQLTVLANEQEEEEEQEEEFNEDEDALVVEL